MCYLSHPRKIRSLVVAAIVIAVSDCESASAADQSPCGHPVEGAESAPKAVAYDVDPYIRPVLVRFDVGFMGSAGAIVTVKKGRYLAEAVSPKELRLSSTSGDGLSYLLRAVRIRSQVMLDRRVVIGLESGDQSSMAVLLIEPGGSAWATVGGGFVPSMFRQLLATTPAVALSHKILLLSSLEFMPASVVPSSGLGAAWTVLGSEGEAALLATNGALVAPVRLPDHAIANKVTAHFVDAVPDIDLELRIRCVGVETAYCSEDEEANWSNARIDSANLSPRGFKSAIIRPYVVDHSSYIDFATLSPTAGRAWPAQVPLVLGIKAVEVEYMTIRLAWPMSTGRSIVFE